MAKRTFRQITSKDYEQISNILAVELERNDWVDVVGLRSWCMDECNKLGIKWWGKDNAFVIPTLIQKIYAKVA